MLTRYRTVGSVPSQLRCESTSEEANISSVLDLGIETWWRCGYEGSYLLLTLTDSQKRRQIHGFVFISDSIFSEVGPQTSTPAMGQFRFPLYTTERPSSKPVGTHIVIRTLIAQSPRHIVQLSTEREKEEKNPCIAMHYKRIYITHINLLLAS